MKAMAGELIVASFLFWILLLATSAAVDAWQHAATQIGGLL